jgi:hypothetical protein
VPSLNPSKKRQRKLLKQQQKLLQKQLPRTKFE